MKKATIYTRKGDCGETSLIGGTRVAKDHIRVEAYGTIDELNANIGLLINCLEKEQQAFLEKIENNLLNIGCHLAKEEDDNTPIAPQEINELEKEIDRIENQLPPMHDFILPCRGEGAARANICRTICRRAERRIITLQHDNPVSPCAMEYINRLSDYFFLLQRSLAANPEKKWEKPCK